MKTAKQLREELAKASDAVKAITDKCKAENRDLDATESAEVDSILGTTDKPGKIAALKDDLARAERLEAADLERVTLENATSTPTIHVKDDVLKADSFYRTGSLKAYTGPQAEANAYKAGRFLMANVFGHGPSRQWCEKNGMTGRFLNTSHQEGANELGGFLVFPEMEKTIIDLREQYGVARRECRIVPMGSDTKRIPRRATGLTAYFTTELGSMTESNKTWDAIELVAKKMYVLTKYSNEVAEDAIISIGDDLTQEGAYQMAVKEDACLFLGDGTSTYGGITGLVGALAAGSTYDAASTHTTFATLTFGDFEGILGKVPTYVRNPKLYISKVGYYASIKRLMDAAGGNSIGDFIAGVPRQFLGLDVVISQTLPSALTSTASTVAAYVGDMSMAVALGDRRGITVKRTDDRYFETDEIGVRMTQRFDINVHERGTATAPGAIQMLKFAAS